MAYFIGVDSAKYKHGCFIMDHNGEVMSNFFTFKNDKTGFNDFYSTIQKLDSSQKRIGFEATGHYGMNLKDFLEDKVLSSRKLTQRLSKSHRKLPHYVELKSIRRKHP